MQRRAVATHSRMRAMWTKGSGGLTSVKPAGGRVSFSVAEDRAESETCEVRLGSRGLLPLSVPGTRVAGAVRFRA